MSTDAITNLDAYRHANHVEANPVHTITVTIGRLPDGRLAQTTALYQHTDEEASNADIARWLEDAAVAMTGPGLINAAVDEK